MIIRLFVIIFGLPALQSAAFGQEISYQNGLRSALKKSDVKLCDTITEGIVTSDVLVPKDSRRASHEICKINFAIAQKDPAICEQLNNDGDRSSRTRCYQWVARSLRLPELCEKIKPQNAEVSLVYRDICRVEAIFETNQCTEGFHAVQSLTVQSLKDREQCLWIVARNGRNESLCAEFESEKYRQGCVQEIKRLRAEDRLYAPQLEPK